jgi:hypothetical protein
VLKHGQVTSAKWQSALANSTVTLSRTFSVVSE